MMSRGISSPVCVRRNPVSMGCWASVLTSTISPRFARAGTVTTARAILDQAFLEAGRERDHDLGAVGPERAVAHLGDRGHALRVGEAHARRERRAPGARAQADAYHLGPRVLLGEGVNPPADVCSPLRPLQPE